MTLRFSPHELGLLAARTLWFCVICLCSVWLTLQPVAANTRLALVIGIDDYVHVPNLSNARRDAELIGDTLTSQGFETTLLVNADRRAIYQAVQELSARAAEAEAVALYFAGHGIQIDGTNYLIPADAALRSELEMRGEAVSLDLVMQEMERAPISMIFLDACRDNPFAEQIRADSRAGTRSLGATRGLAVVRPTGDMMVAYATSPNMVAADGAGRNSPFASALARHIPTPDVEVSVLMKRVTRDVLNETGGQQRPQQLSQMQREFYFARAGEVTETDTIRSLLTVYPHRVGLGDEVSVVADIAPGCTPSFFNLSPSRQVTQIPTQFFRQIAMENGHRRYEISPGSRFGLVVEENDEPGTNTLGYLCETPEATADLGATLRAIVAQLDADLFEGSVTVGGADIVFQMRDFEIAKE